MVEAINLSRQKPERTRRGAHQMVPGVLDISGCAGIVVDIDLKYQRIKIGFYPGLANIWAHRASAFFSSLAISGSNNICFCVKTSAD
jgi:hypothetical protein